MTKHTLVLSCGLAFALTACGGDDEDEAGGDDGTGQPGGVVLVGRVQDARSPGNFVGGAQVTVGDTTATANENGFFHVELGGGGMTLVQVQAAGFARATRRVQVQAGTSNYLLVSLLSFAGGEQTFDAAAGGTVQSGAGSVTFPAGALQATGMVTARLAVLDASNDDQLAAFPGDFTTSDGDSLESFGAIAIEVVDSTGSDVQMAAGASADVAIPVGGMTEDGVPLWYFNEETGLWEEEGMLEGCADGACEGSIAHLSWWNADRVLETTCLNVCAEEESGRPAAGISVEARGVDYNGTSYGTTGEDGCACLPVRIGSQVEVVGVTSGGLVGPVQVATAAAVLACGSPDCASLDAPLTVESPKFQAILTWGEAPGDLDSHLTGPCDPMAQNCTGRFHMFYGDSGSLAGPPWAFLDTDDRSSFGPEVTTLVRCFPGSYRYAIHNYSGSPGLETSEAEVTLFLPDGTTRVDSVPGGSSDLVWIVGDLTCTGSGDDVSCTWASVNRYGPADDQSYHP